MEFGVVFLYFGFGLAENIAIELGYFASANATAKYTISGASATENYSSSGFDAGFVYKPSEDGVFFKAGFHSSKVDGDASASVYASMAVEASEEFVPFEQLTEEVVVEWVKAKLDLESIESSLDTQIAAIKQPTVLSGLPWSVV